LEVGRMAKGKEPIEQYEHLDKMRKNNPPAGLVTPETDRDGEKKSYAAHHRLRLHPSHA
jgi:adenine-specific DNA-methyltransferase